MKEDDLIRRENEINMRLHEREIERRRKPSLLHAYSLSHSYSYSRNSHAYSHFSYATEHGNLFPNSRAIPGFLGGTF